MDPVAVSSLNLKKICLWWTVSLGAILAVGLAISGFGVDHRITRDPDGRLPFDVDRPFTLEFGRGSGLSGFDAISIAEDGWTTVSRPLGEHATLHLSPQMLQRVAQAIVRHELPSLHKSYSSGILDGTQWKIRIRQNQREKDTWFDNLFPASIVGFSVDLDAILDDAGFKTLQWRPADRNPNQKVE